MFIPNKNVLLSCSMECSIIQAGFWKIALYCRLNLIFQNQFNKKLFNIMRKKLGYALWLKIACPGQITQQKFLFPLKY
jgi:hypothetical protein